MKILTQLINNKILLSCLIAWIVPQAMKTIITFSKENRIDIKQFLVGMGGMPSSHASVACALTTSVLLNEGDATMFVVCLIFTLIILRDSIGFRKESGKQAILLNKLASDVYKSNPEKVNEYCGHTMAQVILGAAIGIFIAIVIVLLD